MTDLTPEKLAEWKVLCDKATAGPWYIRTNRHPTTSGKEWGWLDGAPPGSAIELPIYGVTVTWESEHPSQANARLIATARTAMPALIAEVESLRDDLADALDVRSGHGPTALAMVVADRDRERAKAEKLAEALHEMVALAEKTTDTRRCGLAHLRALFAGRAALAEYGR